MIQRQESTLDIPSQTKGKRHIVVQKSHLKGFAEIVVAPLYSSDGELQIGKEYQVRFSLPPEKHLASGVVLRPRSYSSYGNFPSLEEALKKFKKMFGTVYEERHYKGELLKSWQKEQKSQKKQMKEVVKINGSLRELSIPTSNSKMDYYMSFCEGKSRHEAFLMLECIKVDKRIIGRVLNSVYGKEEKPTRQKQKKAGLLSLAAELHREGFNRKEATVYLEDEGYSSNAVGRVLNSVYGRVEVLSKPVQVVRENLDSFTACERVMIQLREKAEAEDATGTFYDVEKDMRSYQKGKFAKSY